MVDIDGFSAYLRANEYAESTVSAYTRILRNYAEYNGGAEPDQERVTQYRAYLSGHNLPQTVNFKLSALSRYCAFAGIAVRVRYIAIQKRTSIRSAITRAELEQLLAGLEQDGHTRFAVIVRLLAQTGARISEVLRLRKCDLLRGFVDMPTKGKVRRIYLPAKLRDELAEYLEQLGSGDYLCRNRFGQQITVSGVEKTLRRYAARYGIPLENAHPHAFRHFYAVEFLRRNANDALLADLLGHSSVNTTRIYLRLTEKQQQEEVDRTVDW